jgi:hypothetical protein
LLQNLDARSDLQLKQAGSVKRAGLVQLHTGHRGLQQQKASVSKEGTKNDVCTCVQPRSIMRRELSVNSSAPHNIQRHQHNSEEHDAATAASKKEGTSVVLVLEVLFNLIEIANANEVEQLCMQ